MWSTFFTLLLGAALGFGADEFKREVRLRRVKRRLKEDLRDNLHMIPQKADTVRRMIAALEHDRLVSGLSVSFLTASFFESFEEVANRFSRKERALLHVVYQYLQAIDETMKGVEVRLLGNLNAPHFAGLCRHSVGRLKDLLVLFGILERLINSFFSKQPEDVLHTDMTLDELKAANFAQPFE
jgi:hypothetical protein